MLVAAQKRRVKIDKLGVASNMNGEIRPKNHIRFDEEEARAAQGDYFHERNNKRAAADWMGGSDDEDGDVSGWCGWWLLWSS